MQQCRLAIRGLDAKAFVRRFFGPFERDTSRPVDDVIHVSIRPLGNVSAISPPGLATRSRGSTARVWSKCRTENLRWNLIASAAVTTALTDRHCDVSDERSALRQPPVLREINLAVS